MIALSGGGTGGHLASLKVLKEAFIEQGTVPIFIGSAYGQDSRWFVEGEGFAARYFLGTQRVMGRSLAGKLVASAMMASAIKKAIRILRKHQTKAVLSSGGYAAAAADFAAVLRGTPLYIHEHNVVSGHLHRLMAPFSQGLFNSYDETSPIRDYPVDTPFFETRRVRHAVKRILFLGGSQGSRPINEFALKVSPLLQQRGIEISHQTGETDLEFVKAGYNSLKISADVFSFDENMATRMSRADFAVTRAGAGTLWELAANGLPALFVPYPHAVRDHQYFNARYFADQGLGFVIREEVLRPKHLFSALNNKIKETSSRLMDLIHPMGAKRIAEFVLKSVGLQHG
jgi:UDP-N-acetylglucosamine--N-acetylmuramyl-(pentapeptide) pyrophosphoryl-undecaprenol N-acetylglucosamine transferase